MYSDNYMEKGRHCCDNYIEEEKDCCDNYIEEDQDCRRKQVYVEKHKRERQRCCQTRDCVPLANDDFACTRSGETVKINILANDFPGNSPLDPCTISILKLPDHAERLTVNFAGVATYTANTRFIGKDTFTYTVSNRDGDVSNKIATVEVDVRCDPPSSSDPRFIYSISSNVNEGREIREYNGGIDTLLTTAPVRANGLASNRDDNLIYYAKDTYIYAYDYIRDVHFTVVDITSDPRFTGDDDLSSGGATYFDGIYYLAGAGSTTGFYRIAFAAYIPGSFAQTITDVTFIPWGDEKTRGMGDMQYDHISGNLVVCSTPGGGAPSSVSIVTADSGIVLSSVKYANSVASLQIARGVNNVFYVVESVTTVVRIINLATGAFNKSTSFIDLAFPPSDMAEYICQPCSTDFCR